MNILAIDTTTKKAQVALKKNDEIIFKAIDNEITHSEKLLPLLSECLKESDTKLSDIDLFACVQGPGSFTGVRIGIATVKALTKVTKKEIFGTTSLKLLALDALNSSTSVPKHILSLMNAKNNRVYYELFDCINNTLQDTNFSGNNLIENVLTEIKNMNLDNLLIVVDNLENIQNTLTTSGYEFTKGILDLKNIFKLDMSKDLYSYLSLDAKYYRKSEAERTKYGD